MPIVTPIPRVALRRAFSLGVAVFALALLAAIGRYAIGSSSAPAAASAQPNLSADAGADAGDADPNAVSADSPAERSSADAAEAGRPAVETLDDGGVIVDLNLANEEELRRLPGIGPVRARAIVDLRRRLGRFKTVDDLARLKGFGRATLRRLRPITRT